MREPWPFWTPEQEDRMDTLTPYRSDETDAAGMPVLDDRCEMQVKWIGFRDRTGDFQGIVLETRTNTRWKVYAASCGAPCRCAARVKRILR